MNLRPISAHDLDLICSHRELMFQEAGRAQADLDLMTESFCTWLEPRLADGRYFGFIAEEDGFAIGGVGLMVIDWPPHPNHPTDDRRGYVLNLFVMPDWRGEGVAKRLMAAAESAFIERGIVYAILHATEAGRPLYERTGWARTTEMGKLFGR
jgi:GNAT superfamily N-acetyltransferase